MAPVHQRLGRGLPTGSRIAAPARPTEELSSTLSELWRLRQADKADRRVGFLPWSLKVPEPKTGTLDFDRFPFQRELYDEAAADKEVVIQKASQVGISTYALRWALYWADVRGWTGLYVFPKRQQMYDFSDARVKPVILRSEYLRERVVGSSVMNKGLKEVGLGLVYFRGSETRDDLLAIDADHVVMDEYDDLRPENVPDAEKRVGASPHGLIRRVGVPTYPDVGISQLYDRSDQRRWTVKCTGCGEWQAPDFAENVDTARAALVCRRCAKQLDVATGEWVAEFPDRGVRGYHVSRLLLPGADIAGMIERSRKRRPLDVANFYNHDLGLAYAAEEGRLSDSALQAAQNAGGGYTTAPGYVGPDLVTAGIDVSSVRELHVRISRHVGETEKVALFLGTVNSFDELGPLMDRYGVRMAAIDHLPEGRLARSFAERYAGRVYLVAQSTKEMAQVLKVDDEARLATVRRVEMLDATLEMIRSQRNKLPLDWPDDYARHMKALQRTVSKDDVGRVTVGYTVTGGTDGDYAFAEAYDVVATELWWYRQAITEQQRETFSRLEDRLEFTRAELADIEADPGGYYEGPSEEVPWMDAGDGLDDV